jgi:hypothetical protein
MDIPNWKSCPPIGVVGETVGGDGDEKKTTVSNYLECQPHARKIDEQQNNIVEERVEAKATAAEAGRTTPSSTKKKQISSSLAYSNCIATQAASTGSSYTAKHSPDTRNSPHPTRHSTPLRWYSSQGRVGPVWCSWQAQVPVHELKLAFLSASRYLANEMEGGLRANGCVVGCCCCGYSPPGPALSNKQHDGNS